MGSSITQMCIHSFESGNTSQKTDVSPLFCHWVVWCKSVSELVLTRTIHAKDSLLRIVVWEIRQFNFVRQYWPPFLKLPFSEVYHGFLWLEYTFCSTKLYPETLVLTIGHTDNRLLGYWATNSLHYLQYMLLLSILKLNTPVSRYVFSIWCTEFTKNWWVKRKKSGHRWN